ncbi:MAG: ribosome biogenesis GTPase YqeH [Fusobacteriaceae bacterium]
MKLKKCVGCGIELQTESPNKEGYITADVFESKRDKHFCQRCFKLVNYGKNIPVIFDKDDYKKEVLKACDSADVVLAVFDIIDFECSFDETILDVLRDMNSIIVVNKLDLVPDEKHPSEVSDWVKKRLEAEDIVPLDIAIISTKNGYGVSGIYKKINHYYKDGAKAVVIGVTNVGKSSIINKLLGEKRATVSKYPGTTLKSMKHMIPKTNIELMDTPGLIPKGRISDLVCGECNLKIIPSGEISRKTFKLDKDRVVFLGGLVSFKINSIEEELKPIISIYASKNIEFLETNLEKQKEYLQNNRTDIFSVPCEKCVDDYKKNEIIKKNIIVQTGEELVFKGLGWLTVKRGPLNIEITMPKAGEILVRDAFVKPKR